MKSIIKIVLVIITVTIAFLCSSIVSLAFDESFYSSISYYEDLQDAISKASIEFAKSFNMSYSNQLEVHNLIPIVSDRETIAFETDYCINNKLYGYAVVEILNEEINLKMINANQGQLGIYDSITRKAKEANFTNTIRIDKYLYELSDCQYAIKIEDISNNNTYYYDIYGNIIESCENVIASTQYANSQIIFIPKINWTSNKYKVDSKKTIELKKFKERSRLLSESYVESRTLRYACAIQALLQIAYMEKLTTYNNLDIINTYYYLWKEADVDVFKEENGIEYGGCTVEEAGKAFIKYAQKKGYKKSESTYTNNPSVSWIKDKLSKNQPILMGYGINVDGEIQGHGISILGYFRAKKVSSGNTWNYLEVYNSWDTSVCYLNYSTVDFDFCQAISFDIKK